jgi:hypothetical protein
MYTYLLIAIMTFLLLGHFLPNLSQFRIAPTSSVTEGLKSGGYDNYDSESETNPMYLATKNAANISFLKDQLDKISGIQALVQDLSGKIALNAYNIEQFTAEAQKKTKALQKATEEAPPN